ncbi:serine hydrolase domain-containing protein [Nocardiopsis changdeensis]|uniref:serine hydrolase domain-containing protein n=1 Tax=Nocardiopsis changdeensis TaxID=2831969 RepID=UPI003F46A688
MSPPPAARLHRIAARYAARPTVSAFAAAIEQPSTGFSWSHGDTERPYFIASITKLYTVAVVMQLRDEGALTLDTPAADLIGADTMRGLNTHGGRDHGPRITVRELLSQTSGIPDYFEQKRPDGTTFLDDVLRADAAWTADELIDMARRLPSPFAPSTPGRAYYSDTNYQLVGRIIETVTSGSQEEALRTRITGPLGLRDTWMLTPDTLDRYGEAAPLLHRRRALHIPRAIASFPPDGAVVSTVSDQLRFLRAFTGGRLFPEHYLAEMTARWNPVFSRLTPIDYGTGIMRFRVPRVLSPFAPVPTMVGHSGAFGNALYHLPGRDLYVAATVNQMEPRSLVHGLVAQLVARL